MKFKEVPIQGSFLTKLSDGTYERWVKLSETSACLWQSCVYSSFSPDWDVLLYDIEKARKIKRKFDRRLAKLRIVRMGENKKAAREASMEEIRTLTEETQELRDIGFMTSERGLVPFVPIKISPLMKAAREGDIKAIHRILSEINHPSHKGRGLLNPKSREH